jgi:hypothetical protein
MMPRTGKSKVARLFNFAITNFCCVRISVSLARLAPLSDGAVKVMISVAAVRRFP